VDVVLPDDLGHAFDDLRPALEQLGRARPLARVAPGTALDAGGGSLAVVVGRIEAAVRSAAAEDADTAGRERARLDKELAEAERMLASAQARLGDASFVERAPAHVVDGARARVAELDERVIRLRQHRAALDGAIGR
jgi:valyl-tRNA synthetase